MPAKKTTVRQTLDPHAVLRVKSWVLEEKILAAQDAFEDKCASAWVLTGLDFNPGAQTTVEYRDLMLTYIEEAKAIRAEAERNKWDDVTVRESLLTVYDPDSMGKKLIKCGRINPNAPGKVYPKDDRLAVAQNAHDYSRGN